MHRLSNRWLYLLLCVSLYGHAESPAVAEPRDKASEQLLALLNEIDSLTADYRQVDTMGREQTGRFWLKKPARFRVESDAPLSQTIVSDGETLWTYDRDLEQVIIAAVSGRVDEMPVLLFAGDPGRILDAYWVETFSDADLDYFLLNPRQESSLLAGVALTFAGDTPLRITVENTMGDTTTIDLLDVSRAPVPAGTFTLALPEGVDVIDDRQPPDKTATGRTAP